MLADASVFGIAACDIMKRNIRLFIIYFFASVYLLLPLSKNPNGEK